VQLFGLRDQFEQSGLACAESFQNGHIDCLVDFLQVVRGLHFGEEKTQMAPFVVAGAHILDDSE